jgi:hypothetical protein
MSLNANLIFWPYTIRLVSTNLVSFGTLSIFWLRSVLGGHIAFDAIYRLATKIINGDSTCSVNFSPWVFDFILFRGLILLLVCHCWNMFVIPVRFISCCGSAIHTSGSFSDSSLFLNSPRCGGDVDNSSRPPDHASLNFGVVGITKGNFRSVIEVVSVPYIASVRFYPDTLHTRPLNFKQNFTSNARYIATAGANSC